jgi:glycosyltransferase 2 family protein
VHLVRWLRRPIVWAPISLGLLVFVALRSRVWEAGERLGSVDPRPLVAALALSALLPALWAIRSANLLGASGSPVPIVHLVPMTAFANTVNNLTPASSGEVFRLWLLRVHHAVPYSVGGAVILVERLGALGWLTGSAVLFWLGSTGVLDRVAVAVLLAALVALPAVVYRSGVRPVRLMTRLPGGRLAGTERWSRLEASAARVDDTVARLVTHPVRLIAFAAITSAILATNTAQLLLVGQALGVQLDPVAAWGALGLGLTAGILSLLPFGLGSTDLVLATLLVASGVPSVEAAAMTFGYRLVSTLPLGLAGVASYAVLSARLPGPSGWDAAREGVADRDARPR